MNLQEDDALIAAATIVISHRSAPVMAQQAL